MEQEKKSFICLLLFIIVLFGSMPVQAAGIEVLSVRGVCEFKRGSAEWTRILLKTLLQEGDNIRTGSDSSLTVKFNSTTQLRIAAFTSLILYDDDAPNTHSVFKGLVELLRGKLIISLGGIRNAWRIRATTPTAVIGVRGTEFFLIGDKEITTVGVYDGAVTVANIMIPDKTVQVGAGSKTAVFAGRPPLPPTPLSLEERKESDHGGSSLDRIEDAAVEATEQLPIEKYIAFSDLHIDAIRNPAYAARVDKLEAQVFSRLQFKKRERTETPDGFFLAGTRVEEVEKKSEYTGKGAEIWGTIFRPTEGGDVLGAFGSYQRERVKDTETFTGTATVGSAATPFWNEGSEDSPNLSSRFGAVDIGGLFTHSMINFDFGILARYHNSSARSDSVYRQVVSGLPDASNLFKAKGNGELKEVILGIRRVGSNGVEWGWSVGINNSNSHIYDTVHTMDKVSSPLQSTRETFDGLQTEMRVRRQFSEKWRWGASFQTIILKGTGDLTDDTGLSFTESVHDQFFRLGIGMGYTPDQKTALGLDLVACIRKEKADQYYLSSNPKVLETENDPSISLHFGGQRWLTDKIFCFFDGTFLMQRIRMDFTYYADGSAGSPIGFERRQNTEKISEWMGGLGYKINKNAWIEYLLVEPFYSSHGLQHNLLIRWRR